MGTSSNSGRMLHEVPNGDYAYDVFLSYPRNSFVEAWVRDLLYPMLRDELSHLLPDRDPRIFVDFNIPTGEQWPTSLRRALLHSRCLVGVWSAQYFRSSWCLAEWKTMHERGVRFGGSRLVLPLVVRDGDTFPSDARGTQMWDFKQLCYDADAIRNTHPKLYALHQAIQAFAEELLSSLMSVPVWSADFPICMPEPDDAVTFRFPRLS